MTDQQTPERIIKILRNHAEDPMWADHCEMHKTVAAKAADMLEAAEKRIAELEEVLRCERLLVRDLKADLEIVNHDKAKSEAERDEALAASAAREIAMRDLAAEHAWNKRDLLADAEKKQIDAGLSGRDYYGRRLEAELLSRSIRALPLSPDGQQALRNMIEQAVQHGFACSAEGYNGEYVGDRYNNDCAEVAETLADNYASKLLGEKE